MSLETATGRAASKPDLTFVIQIHLGFPSQRGEIL